MSVRANYFKIGMFVISATIIAIIAVVVLGAGALFRKKVLMETYFEETVQGLEIGSPVKFRGVRIGNIEDISLVSQEYITERRYILVRAALSRDVFQQRRGGTVVSDVRIEIDRGLRARLGFQGLTGTAYLETDYLDPKSHPPLEIDWEPRYPYIPSTQSTIARVGVALDRIMRYMESTDIQKLTENLGKSLGLVNKALEGADVGRVSEQAEKLLTEMRATNHRIEQILKDIRLKPILTDASATLASVRRIVEQSEKPMNRIVASLTEASTSINDLSKKLTAFSRDLPESSAELKKILSRLDNLISSQQPNIEVSIKNIKELTEKLNKRPSLLLFGKTPKEPLPVPETQR